MLGLTIEVRPPRIAEVRRPNEPPDVYVERLAVEKAHEAGRLEAGRWIVAGDTVVSLCGEILEKPADGEDAVRMLLKLSGRDHTVLTGIALASPDGSLRSAVDVTRVWFRPFGRALARAYVRTGEPLDKAGAYGIQSLGAALVSKVEGDFYTVMGLSVSLLMALFEASGFTFDFGTRT